MTLEDLADLIRANSANLSRRVDEVHAETYGKLLSMESDALDTKGDVKALQRDMTAARGGIARVQEDMTDVKADVAEVKRSLDLTEIVSDMKRQIEALEVEVAALKGRA